MIHESKINWREFTSENLPESRAGFFLLLRPYVTEKVTFLQRNSGTGDLERIEVQPRKLDPYICTDIWTGHCLLCNDESQVAFFCPVDEVDLPNSREREDFHES